MKNKKPENKEKIYQAYLVIGITLLVVGLIAAVRIPNEERLVGYFFYAMYLFMQAFLSYFGVEDSLKDV